MIDVRIPLFPTDSSAVTVTCTVWLGVCVVVFFNLRFGWTLSGLVVPGYLVPILLVTPVSAGIVFGQAIVTYVIVRAISDGWGRVPWWSSVFGRDRFFLIVLVSILVRVASDGWLLPEFGRWLTESFGLHVDYQHDLHSYGLIVVSLLANYFWKPRLVSGVATSVVTIGLTFALVKYVVLGLTNFNLGSLQYLYEDMSASLLSSPKAYIVIITTAYVASCLNRKYSWDFNGILVPALLALLWHEPAKIAVTIAESLWILILAAGFMKLPIWRGVTIEGGRKLLLFFTIAAAHRLVLAHAIPHITAEFRVTDAFGFGYLLTTLLAVKSYDKKIALQVCRATVQASMIGAVLASLIGFLMTQLPVNRWSLPTRREAVAALPELDNPKSLKDVVARQQLRLYAMRVPETYVRAQPAERSSFRRGVTALLQYVHDTDSNKLHLAKSELAHCNYQLTDVQGRYLVLTERPPGGGRGTYVLDCRADSNLLVSVPSPSDEWGTFEAGLVLFQRFGGRALAVAGAGRLTNHDRSSDVLIRRDTLMSTFHEVVNSSDAIQVRTYTPELLRELEGWDVSKAKHAVQSIESSLWVRRELPPSCNLALLDHFVPSLDIRWRETPMPNVLRDSAPRGFAELFLGQHDLRRFRQVSMTEFDGHQGLQHVDGVLNDWLRTDRLQIARQGSDAYRPATFEEMLYFDEQAIRPLLRLSRTCGRISDLNPRELDQARTINAACNVVNYELIHFHDRGCDDDYFILVERSPRDRHWGTFVFRPGAVSPYVVEVQRPLYERQTHQFGAALFQQLDASALLIAGAHPFANRDGTADILRLANKVNAPLLVRQVLFREFPTKPLLTIQTRSIQAPVDTDVVVATDTGATGSEQASELVRDLVNRLAELGMTTQFVDGSASTAGYELGLQLQAASLNHSSNKHSMTIWLSPALRQRYRDSRLLQLASSQFDAVGISTVQQELSTFLRDSATGIPSKPLAADVRDAVLAYCRNGDVTHLYRLVNDHPHMQFSRLIDISSDQSFLIVREFPNDLPEVFNLDGSLSVDTVVLSKFSVHDVSQFARSRRFHLRWSGTP